MRSELPPLFDREKILAGLPARRATALVFAIEGRAAQLAARRRQSMASYLDERSAAEQEQAFLDALAGGRDLPVRPTAAQLEVHAPGWATLVPPDPELRAATARLLGRSYRLPEHRTRRLRQALGLDDPAVVASFERQFGEAVATVFAPSLPVRERLAWKRAGLADRIENLPPFWMAFAVTLTETIGAGILALPIAMAAIGPLPGIVLLILFGLVNMVTVAALCEAITRDGGMRYGTAYFGHLVRSFLGRPGAVLLSCAVLALNVVVLLVLVLGVGMVLGSATGSPAWPWAVALGVVHLAVLRRETLNGTIASAMVIGAVNIVLLVLVMAVALPHVRMEHLLLVDVPFVGGRPLDASLIGLVFGVVLVTYFGHTSAANVAKVVLRRDPTGRTLVRGNVAAMGTVIVVNCLFVAVVCGALGADPLVGFPGTALTPLGDLVGTRVTALGVVYAVLSMGLVSLYFALGLRNQVAEWTRFTRRLGRNRRFLVETAPVVAVLAVTVTMLVTGGQTFTAWLNAVGVLVVPLLAGVFPMLMVAAARRRGEYVPGSASRLVGHPAVVAAVALLFLGAVLLHGLVIWDGPVERLAATAVAVVMATVVVLAVRDGALRPRTVIELRVDERAGKRVWVAVTSAGAPAAVDLSVAERSGRRGLQAASADLGHEQGLRSVGLRLPEACSEVKVWTHRVTEDGDSVALPASVAVGTTGEPQHTRDGVLVLRSLEAGTELEIRPS